MLKIRNRPRPRPIAMGEGWQGPAVEISRATFRPGRFAASEYTPATQTITVYLRSKGRILAVHLSRATVIELAAPWVRVHG